MFPATSQQLVALIRRSELASESLVDRWEKKYLTTELPLDDFCECLRHEAILSDWQLSQLLEGKSRGFFLGKYKLIRQLGAGAMGSVFLAEHRQMKHRVAIKVLAKRLLGKDKHLLRFEKEAQAAVRVNHPRIVRAYDLDQVGDIHFLVMEYVEGQTLQHLILREGPLDIPLAVFFLRQIAEGLAAAHQANLIHRDIKPANILIDPQKQIHILDLGLARILDDDEESSLTLINGSRMIGTVDYLAPEQAVDCHHIDGRADLYSLGCTLYYMLTGQPPFSEGTIPQRILAHQTQMPREITTLRSDCPSELERICFKLLAKSPADRFASAKVLIEAIDLFNSEEQNEPGRLTPLPEVRIAPPSSDDSMLMLAPEDSLEKNQSGEWKAKTMANRSNILAPRSVTPSSSSKPNKIDSPKSQSPSVKAIPTVDLFSELDAFSSSSHNGSGSWSEQQLAPALSLAGDASSEMSGRSGEEQTAAEPTWYERMVQAVAEKGDGPGGLSYSLWFLILFGVITGLIVVVVGTVTIRSFKAPEVKHQNFEN